MIILGIETSCDETAAAIAEGRDGQVKILSNVVSSQIAIHQKYGGVVPEVAAREHVLNILPVINEALEKAGINLPNNKATKKKTGKKIDAIAVTTGPGLITSLLTGVETAKTLSYVWNLPLVSVNHIAGHIYANFIDKKTNQIKFPAIILTVSGGHTMIVLMSGQGKFKTIGETRDDAAGEAFDKAAQLLGVGYPGGPIISKLADGFIQAGQTNLIKLPRPMIYDKSYDFSFSGLKTALLYQIKNDKNWKNRIPEYACEFQQAIIDVLIHKTIKAAKQYNAKTVMLAGGVSANTQLRQQLEIKVKNELPKTPFYIPDFSYCTDNAAMLATAGYYSALDKKFTLWKKIKTDSNLELK